MDLPASLGNRIGILGGTFDPVHHGHLAIARAARQQFALDAVLFIPAAQPPHKLSAPLAPFSRRAAMILLTIAGQPDFVLSEMEKERPGPSYSIDTLKELRQQLGEKVHLFFLIGMDAFAEITTWKHYAELFRYAEFVVVERPGAGGQAAFVAAAFPSFRLEGSSWVGPGGIGRIHSLAMPSVSISSSLIRAMVSQGDSVAGLVPGPVAAYIVLHGLYRSMPSEV